MTNPEHTIVTEAPTLGSTVERPEIERRGLAFYAQRFLKMRETGLLLILFVLVIVMSLASPVFLTWSNLEAMAMAFAVEGIVVACAAFDSAERLAAASTADTV